MAQPTETNHTGVESYDHSAVKTLREYHDAHAALDGLVKAMQRDEVRIGQEEFLRMVEQIGASLSYSDSSGHPQNGCEAEHEGAWPYRVELNDDGTNLHGSYRCSRCGSEWTCGYDVNVGDWF
jgi:hypothetical protein